MPYRYYWLNMERCKENSRRYAQANKEKVREKQREYYYKVLKPMRDRDRIWNNADKPPKIKKPIITKTKTYFGPKIDVTAKDVPIPEPKGRLTYRTDITLDWS